MISSNLGVNALKTVGQSKLLQDFTTEHNYIMSPQTFNKRYLFLKKRYIAQSKLLALRNKQTKENNSQPEGYCE